MTLAGANRVARLTREFNLAEFRRTQLDQVPLERAHQKACRLADALLPARPIEA